MKNPSAKQIRQFHAEVIQALPDLDADTMQGWIGNAGALSKVLREVLAPPTTFGAKISSPFDGAELISDGPGDEELLANIDRLKLTDVRTADDPDYIRFEEACKRGSANPETNWGQRAAFGLRDAGNAGRISTEVWPVGRYVICPKTRWRNPQSGNVCAWYVHRHENGFHCDFCWFDVCVDRRGQFASLGK